MNIKASTALLVLAQGATITLPDARGAVIRVLAGELWITQDGDPEDHFAGAAESFRVSRSGATVVQALHDARLVVEAAHASALETWQEPLARPRPIGRSA
jgi:hypothetical protein